MTELPPEIIAELQAIDENAPDDTFTQRFVTTGRDAVEVTYLPLTSSGYNASQTEGSDAVSRSEEQ